MARTRQIFDFHARQGKARPAQGGGREISAISSPAFVILPSVGDYFDLRHKGSNTMLKYKNIRKLPSHESVGRLVGQDKILFRPRSSKLEVAFSAAGFLQICDS